MIRFTRTPSGFCLSIEISASACSIRLNLTHCSTGLQAVLEPILRCCFASQTLPRGVFWEVTI